MRHQPVPLAFSAIDKLAFAAARGRLRTALATAAGGYAADELGPLLELLYAVRSAEPEAAADVARLVSGRGGLGEFLPRFVSERRTWVSGEDGSVGFHRTRAADGPDEETWISFLIAARRAAKVAGLPAREGAQVVAAMRELRGNIDEHSGAPDSGVVAFKAGPRGRFEFVVADRGDGLLTSLRSSPEYTGLRSHAEALRLALKEGESRKGRGKGHGNGFRPIFAGLADMRGQLRFRSGDHALLVDGRFDLQTAAVAQKAALPGFITVVSCTP